MSHRELAAHGKVRHGVTARFLVASTSRHAGDGAHQVLSAPAGPYASEHARNAVFGVEAGKKSVEPLYFVAFLPASLACSSTSLM